MSDNNDNKKKGFFSRIFGGFSAPKEIKPKEAKKEQSTEAETISIPNKSALNKMKKADIVAVAKENDLELDIKLTKAQLLDAWESHFNLSSPSAVEDAATVMAESASSQVQAPDDEAIAEEEDKLKQTSGVNIVGTELGQDRDTQITTLVTGQFVSFRRNVNQNLRLDVDGSNAYTLIFEQDGVNKVVKVNGGSDSTISLSQQ